MTRYFFLNESYCLVHVGPVICHSVSINSYFYVQYIRNLRQSRLSTADYALFLVVFTTTVV
jgi:hypothetical protein